MVEGIARAGVSDPDVLWAMRNTERHRLLDGVAVERAYEDTPLPIGGRQTISQPLVVGLMTELLVAGLWRLGVGSGRGGGGARGRGRVLEIGTGSGYQGLVLSHLFDEVYSVERIWELYQGARERLGAIEYSRVRVRYGDGRDGWQEHAPYGAVIITAAASEVPGGVWEQVGDPGVLVAPLGQPSTAGYQRLTRMSLQDGKVVTEYFNAVVFVPLLGGVDEAGKSSSGRSDD